MVKWRCALKGQQNLGASLPPRYAASNGGARPTEPKIENGQPKTENRAPKGHLIGPFPVHDLGLIDTVFICVIAASNLLVPELIFGVSSFYLETGHAIDDIDGDAEAVDSVANRQFERCIDVPALVVPVHMEIVVIVPAINQAVDHPGIVVEVENHRLIESKQAIKIAIGLSVRM